MSRVEQRRAEMSGMVYYQYSFEYWFYFFRKGVSEIAYPNLEDYLCESEQYQLIPVWEELLVDLETPISLFKKVVTTDPSFLLESVVDGEQLDRYSLFGFQPLLTFRAKGSRVEVEQDGVIRVLSGDPLAVLKGVMDGLLVGPIPPEPRFFGGAVGYFGYDLIRQWEKIPTQAVDDLSLPDCCFILTKFVLIYDHLRHSLKIVNFVVTGDDPDLTYRQAICDLARIRSLVENELPAGQRQPVGPKLHHQATSYVAQANISKELFMDNVHRAKEYIMAGDIFQVVLSQRFQRPVDVGPLDIYRVLRCVNPSPYMYYLNFGDLQLVGSSPEMLVRVENGKVETHPIAGTRPRGMDQAADAALAQELLGDLKERAEHLMLVDLGRNDLGRVATSGTVVVESFMDVKRYSHVMHLASVVSGSLAPGCDAYDALMSCFPAGTVSGAPKIRALEIIDELEPVRRGPYAGAIGYLSFNGNLDSCITIRTILIKDGMAYVQAGAGIVADSDPETEYEESVHKAGALLKALCLANDKEGAA
jgi:anthranilate synthase component 1